MSITLDLTEELEGELAAEAARRGLPLNEYVLRLLVSAQAIENRPQSGVELVQYWQAEELIGTRPDISDSQAHARQLREQAERREPT